MNDAVRTMLCEVVRQYGRDAIYEPGRLGAILRDKGAKHKRDVSCLISGLQAGVPQEIVSSSAAVPWEVLEARLVRRILDDVPLTPEAARDCVQAWATALNRTPAQTPPPPRPAQPSPSSQQRPVEEQSRIEKPAPPPTRPTAGARKSHAQTWVAVGLVLLAVAAAVYLSPLWRTIGPSTTSPAPRPDLLGLGRHHAVLVGINRYADEQVQPRGRAEADARAFHALLTDRDRAGADPERVHLLLGGKATKANILHALRETAKKAERNDPVILAFFVQGAMDRSDGCLLGSDTVLPRLGETGLRGGDLAEALRELKSRRVAVFLDVNFRSVRSSDGSVPRFGAGSPYRGLIGDDGSDWKLPLPGRVLFRATDGRSSSLELAENGAFAQAVLQGLRGAADSEGDEADGLVSARELAIYLNKEMPALLGKHGKDEELNLSPHDFSFGAESRFALVLNPAEADTASKRLSRFDALAKKHPALKDVAAEGRELLRQMPPRKRQRELRKEYVKLAEEKIDPESLLRKRAEILATGKLPRGEAETFASRVVEVIKLAEDEHFLRFNRGDLIADAVRALYRSAEAGVPEELGQRLREVAGKSEDEQKKLLADAREALGRREALGAHQDIDVASSGMLQRMDPYSKYVSPSQLDEYRRNSIRTDFTGVGFMIGKDRRSEFLRVVTPLYGTPAHRAGMQADDLITTIVNEVDAEGKKLDRPRVTSTRGLTTQDAVRLMVGKEGTPVRLTVQREGQVQPIEFPLTRARIRPETVLGWQRKDDGSWDYLLDPTKKIAYIRVRSQGQHTATDLGAALAGLKAVGLRGLILDLRGNGGGFLDSSIDSAALFVDDKLIAAQRNRAGNETQHRGKKTGNYLDFPMACLIDGTTGSGAEIIAACLQDHKRALILGERSFGKGCSQRAIPFDGGQLEITTTLVYRPSGRCLHRFNHAGKEPEHWGIVPDRVVALTPLEREALLRWQERIVHILPPSRRAAARMDRQL